jgi:4'-phosphopantetheinyl transferase
LRRLAANIHAEEPAQWSVHAEADRIPTLQSMLRPAESALHASLTHSGDWLAAAIAPFPIGIDLECPGKPRDLLALADAVFSPEEQAQLRRLHGQERAAAFYRYWTIKESVGKREGHGLHRLSARRQRPIPCAPEAAEVRTWQLDDGSLAIAGETGMSVRVLGPTEMATPRYWRIERL